eukprot:1362248-Amorphochlora_amoeboformis.AAC.2
MAISSSLHLSCLAEDVHQKWTPRESPLLSGNPPVDNTLGFSTNPGISGRTRAYRADIHVFIESRPHRWLSRCGPREGLSILEDLGA